MRSFWLGMLIVATMIGTVAAWQTRDEMPARPSNTTLRSQSAQQGTIALTTEVLDANTQQPYQLITLIDPARQVMSVYRIDCGRNDTKVGNIRLCCVRNIRLDQQMIQFNGEQPLPREIEEILRRGTTEY